MSNEEQMRAALAGLLDRYVELVNSGDAGNWDPETEKEVIAARDALSNFASKQREIDDLRAQPAAVSKMGATEAAAKIPAIMEYVTSLEDRLAVANKRLEEAGKSEPIGFVVPDVIESLKQGARYGGARISPRPDEEVGTTEAIYARPIPPADVADQIAYLENQASKNADLNDRQALRIAELERRIAEQQAKIMRYEMQDGATAYIEGFEEINKLLSEAQEEGRKEAVPDGWQVVPKVCTTEMAEPWGHWHNLAMQTAYDAMLAAAPSPASLNAKERGE